MLSLLLRTPSLGMFMLNEAMIWRDYYSVITVLLYFKNAYVHTVASKVQFIIQLSLGYQF